MIQKTIQQSVEELKKKLKIYMNKTKKTVPTIAKEIGYHKSHIYYFLNGERTGSVEFLTNLEIYLQNNSNFSTK